VKAGARAVGVAESYADNTSTLGAVVVRRDRAVESVSFGECTVGGLDATERVGDVVESLARPDARYVFVAGVALAWYNVLNLHALHERVDRPLLAVGFEASEGLEPALREAFDGRDLDARLARYRALPPRRPVAVGRDDRNEGDAKQDASIEGERTSADAAGGDGGTEADDDDDDVVYVRALGLGEEHAAEVVRGFTHEGGRPEPVRVAREAARAGDELRQDA
jgi:endonuclease V-like protein UPF0215 family